MIALPSPTEPDVVALARRVEVLQRSVEALRTDVGRAQESGNTANRAVAGLADRIAELNRPGSAIDATPKSSDYESVPSWLTAGTELLINDLVVWLENVLIHYPGSIEALGDCWPHHPWAVEELLALQTAWHDAYTSKNASGTKAVDWHDRHRPGVLARIAHVTAGCSPTAHQPGGRLHAAPPSIPGSDQVAAVIGQGMSVHNVQHSCGEAGQVRPPNRGTEQQY